MFLVIRGTKLPKATEFQMNAEPKTLESDRLLSYLHQDFNRAPGCLATDFDWLHYTLCVLRDDSLHCSADHHLSWRSTSLTGMYFFSKCNKFLKVRLWKCPRAPQSDIYSRVTQSFFFFFFLLFVLASKTKSTAVKWELCVTAFSQTSWLMFILLMELAGWGVYMAPSPPFIFQHQQSTPSAALISSKIMFFVHVFFFKTQIPNIKFFLLTFTK